jgi:hypothetical protein
MHYNSESIALKTTRLDIFKYNLFKTDPTSLAKGDIGTVALLSTLRQSLTYCGEVGVSYYRNPSSTASTFLSHYVSSPSFD